MNLTINGELRELSNVKTITDVLTHFSIQNKIVVVELNRVIVDREKYSSTYVNDGDRMEIVHFVGGG